MQAADSSKPCPVGEMPNEILLVIISQLKITRGYDSDPLREEQRRKNNKLIVASLYSLTLTSYLLARIATPFLYQNFIQPWSNLECTKYYLESVIKNRKLVRHLEYIEDFTIEKALPEARKYYDEEFLDTVTQILATANLNGLNLHSPYQCRRHPDMFERYGLTEKEKTEGLVWSHLEQTRNRDPHLFALITLCTLADNLREFALHGHKSLFVVLAFKEFSHGLKTLWLSNSSSSRSIMMTCRANLFAHTNLFKNHMLSDALELLWFRHQFGKHQALFQGRDLGAALEEISLDIYDCAASYLDKAIGCCRTLKHFSCCWVPEPWSTPRHVGMVRTSTIAQRSRQMSPGRPQSDIDLPRLHKALSKFSSCLESLKINTLDSEWQVSVNTDIPPLGSLRNFTALTKLDVSGIVLFGDCEEPDFSDLRFASILPESLETLNVDIEWDDDIENALYALLSECSSSLPALKKIMCTWRPAPKIIADYLIGAFKAVGVEMTLSVDKDGEIGTLVHDA